jgi:hypothetical protein
LHGAGTALLLCQKDARQRCFERAAGLGEVALLAEDFEAGELRVGLRQ